MLGGAVGAAEDSRGEEELCARERLSSRESRLPWDVRLLRRADGSKFGREGRGQGNW